MAFYDNFIKLCKERDVYPSHVALAIGLTSASPTYWKRGAVPKANTVQKIADYFGVSIDYLLGDNPKAVCAIRQIRLEKGITLKLLAERAGIPGRSLELYESGHMNPSAQHLQQIADALSISVEDLYSTGEATTLVELFPDPGGAVPTDGDYIIPGNHDIAFFRDYSSLSEEDKESIRQFAEFIKQKEKKNSPQD